MGPAIKSVLVLAFVVTVPLAMNGCGGGLEEDETQLSKEPPAEIGAPLAPCAVPVRIAQPVARVFSPVRLIPAISPVNPHELIVPPPPVTLDPATGAEASGQIRAPGTVVNPVRD